MFIINYCKIFYCLYCHSILLKNEQTKMQQKNFGWFLISLKPNCLRLAEINLSRQGFKIFSPKCQVTSRNSKHFINRLVPLFPGYLFVEIDSASPSIKSLRATRGVSNIVNFCSNYTPLPLSIIEKLQAKCDCNGIFSKSPKIQKGQTVKIERGPFATFFAKVESLEPNQRAFLLVEFLGKKIKINTAINHLV